MCRVLLADNKFIKTMGFANMLTLLHRLEKECGGDGNGYVLLKNGELIGYDKGVKLTNEEIVTQLFMAEPDWFMYHTRIASAGSVSDTNCHPYVSKDKKFALEMNGTDTSFSDLANDYGCTDTYMIFKLFNSNRKSLSIDSLRNLTPKFIGFKEGKVFATNPDSYSGLEFIQDDRGICIASSFPPEMKASKMEHEYAWHEGEEIKKYIPKAYIYGDDKYSYYSNGAWFNYYGENNTEKINSTASNTQTTDTSTKYTNKEVTVHYLKQILKNAKDKIKKGATGEEAIKYIGSKMGLEPMIVNQYGEVLDEVAIDYDTDLINGDYITVDSYYGYDYKF